MKSNNALNNYLEEDYETKGRFCSYWHQIDEVRKAMPRCDGQIVVIGKGSGFIDNYLSRIGYTVTTIDIDEMLAPTYCASVLNMPLPAGSVDLVVCCQVLEHLPFEQFPLALTEIRRIIRSGGTLVLSLPDLTRTYRFILQLPKIGEQTFLLSFPIPEWLKRPWIYNGEHYWNIGNKGYPAKNISSCVKTAGFNIIHDFRVFEMSWHRFYISHARS